MRPLLVLILSAGLLAPVPAAAISGDPLETVVDVLADGDPGTWEEFGVSPHIDGRQRQVMVHAPELDALIVWGGYTRQGQSDDLWLLDLGVPSEGWREIVPQGEGPEVHTYGSGIWDPAESRMVIFGGYRPDSSQLNSYGVTNEVWAIEFDEAGTTAQWRLLHEGTTDETTDLLNLQAPTPRAYHAAVYDPAGRRMLVSGGLDLLRYTEQYGIVPRLVDEQQRPRTGRRLFKYALGDLWAYDLDADSWSLLSEEAVRRLDHQAVWDPAHGQVVVSGGYGPHDTESSWYRHEVESFASGAWTRWAPAGERIAMRDSAYGYSAEAGGMVLFGYDQDNGAEADARAVHLLRFGPAGVGAEWVQVPAASLSRPSLPGMRGIVLPGPDRFIVMGGLLSSSAGTRDYRVWSFDLATRRWSKPLGSLTPVPEVVGAKGVYVPGWHAFMFIGGDGNRVPWRLDMATGEWGPTPGGGPAEGVPVYDTVRDRVIVMEGCTQRFRYLDVAGGTGWHDLDPTGDVPPLCGPQVAFDPPRNRLLLTGGSLHMPGFLPSIRNTDLFALEMPADAPPRWEQLAPTGSAGFPRGTLVYDPYEDRMLTSLEAGGMQALDLAEDRDGEWRPLPVLGEAPPAGLDKVFDAANDRILVYDGCGNGDVHRLSLGDSPEWSLLPTENAPAPRCEGAVAYDSIGRRFVLATGDEGFLSNRTDVLHLGGDMTPPPVESSPPGPAPAPFPPVVGGTWEAVGPNEAHMHDVDFDLADDERALVAASVTSFNSPDSLGIFLSEDRGRSWTPALGDTAGVPVIEIAQSPADPQRIYAGSYSTTLTSVWGTGMYVSEDGGASWRRSTEGLPWDAFWSVAVHPTDPLVAWAGGQQGGIYRTDNGGDSWREVAGEALDGSWANGLAAIPVSGGVRLIAAVRSSETGLIGEGGAFVSDDGGFTWRAGFLTDGQDVKALAVDPSDPRRVLAAEGWGVWRSDDAGSTWTHVNGNTFEEPTGDDLQLGSMDFDPTSGGQVVWGGGLVYACDFKDGIGGGAATPPATPGVWRSTNGGASWAQVDGPPAWDEYCGIAVSPDGSSIIASGVYSGLWRSDDGGETWEESSGGVTMSTFQGAAGHPANPDVIVVADLERGLLRTTDGGDTWSVVLEGSGFDVVASPAKPGRFIAKANFEVYVSEDGGATWTGRDVDPDWLAAYSSGLAAHSTDPDTWYFSAKNGISTGIGITTDNGATRQFVSVRDPNTLAVAGGPWTMVVDPHDPSTIYVGDKRGSGVFRSQDGGQTWFNVGGPGFGGGYITSMAADPATPGRLWAGTELTGVYRSDDGGETWVPARRGVGWKDIRGIVVVGGRVIAGAKSFGYYETNDDGAHWSKINDGAAGLGVYSMSVGANGTVLAALESGGVLALRSA